jgi:hypothetical protein
MVRLTWGGRTGPTAVYIIQKEWVKFRRQPFKLITVDDTVKTNVLGFRDNSFLRYSAKSINYNTYDMLSSKEDWKEK